MGKEGVMKLLFLILLWLTAAANGDYNEPLPANDIEEFELFNPIEVHNAAIGVYMDIRKDNDNETLEYDSTFMELARAHAIDRLILRDEEELRLRTTVESDHDNGNMIGNKVALKLPSPDLQNSALISATNDAVSNQLAVLPEQAQAMALEFSETVGTGAISKSGAITMGDDGSWIKLAEEKIIKDHSLDHHSLMWELGTKVIEKSTIKNGINVTEEERLLRSMEEWFIKGGGKLAFVRSEVSNSTKSNRYRLLANEDIGAGDAVIHIPLKLIMCKQTARNVLIKGKGKYLGDELADTFAKNELWGMALFLLHEYYKEVAGSGSKWGPYLRTLRMRFLSTNVIREIKGTTTAGTLSNWMKSTSSFHWWSSGTAGPCNAISGICTTRPDEKRGDHRFSLNHLRWAYWIIQQNAVKVRQVATGLDFIALVPYYNMLQKKPGIGGSISLDLDGSVGIRVGRPFAEGSALGIEPGNYTDSEYFLRYLSVSKEQNPNNYIKLSLPGAIPEGSKFHYCVKGTAKQMRSDACMGTYKSDSLMWRSSVLGDWRKQMNLPPRLGDIRMLANKLHLYGSDEEQHLINAANHMVAGLPIPVDQMPAEEQLMMMGIAKSNIEAALMVSNPADTQSQLYSAPDPDEDPEALRHMQHLALLAVQAQNVVATGNILLNATRAVLNHTRDFFLHGVLPQAGLDELDEFLLKKIGMISHCGFEQNMRIVYGSITDELMCAMRVHMMNETEMNIFCPQDVKAWEENCHEVEFMNYTAISETNELGVVNALRTSIASLLSTYPTTADEDRNILDDRNNMGEIRTSAITVRLHEKELLLSALSYLNNYEMLVRNGSVPFQLDIKIKERVEVSKREVAHQQFMDEIRKRLEYKESVATIEVDMGPTLPKQTLTIEEGQDIKDTVKLFCGKHNINLSNAPMLEQAVRARVINPPLLSMFVGVVTPLGQRQILAVPEGANATVETNVFCAKHNISLSDDCAALQDMVNTRLSSSFYQRRVVLSVPIDALDGRKLYLIIREGEQHDLRQYITDFFTLYHLPMDTVPGMVQEVNRRLPGTVLAIPVSLQAAGQRGVSIVFAANDNITNVVEGFISYYSLDRSLKVELMKRALYGMAPGSYLV